MTALVCPVPGCGVARRRWQAVCDACWRRLPHDLQQAIVQARRAQARHREATAAIGATAWLAAHPPDDATRRVLGEAPG